MSRKRFHDRTTAGRSASVPYIPGEEPGARHARRHGEAQANEERARVFCRQVGLSLSVCNHGHHWIFSLSEPHRMFVAEWWPSSAKLVVQKKWEKGIHVHDVDQVIGVLGPIFQKWQQAPEWQWQ